MDFIRYQINPSKWGKKRIQFVMMVKCYELGKLLIYPGCFPDGPICIEPNNFYNTPPSPTSPPIPPPPLSLHPVSCCKGWEKRLKRQWDLMSSGVLFANRCPDILWHSYREGRITAEQRTHLDRTKSLKVI